ncbi:hypothetical protein TrRE_jg9932, partial [Triparma retinervis]
MVECVHTIQVITCFLFIVESIVVNTVEGLGFRLWDTLDLFLCVLMPFFVFLTVRDNVPITAIRVITLIPRSPFCHRLGLSMYYRLTHMDGNYSASDEDFYLKSEHGEIPSDIPMLRLVQLMKRAIKGQGASSGMYNLEEREELKILLLQIIHHKIYTSTLPNKKNSLTGHQQKEVQKIKNIYTLGKYQSNKSLKPRVSATTDQLFRARGASAGRARGISAPVSVVHGGLGASKLSIQASVDNYLDEVMDIWDFNVFQLGRIAKGRPLTGLALHMFNDSRYSWKEMLNTNEFQFEAFISEVERTYGPNVYHNKFHAADVAQSTHYFLMVTDLQSKLNSMEVFSLMFSAIIHDFRHPGFNNAFLCKIHDPLAVTYNDSSVLENFHVASAYKLLENDKMNFLKNLDVGDKSKVREHVIGLVLATDLKHHFESVAEFRTELAARQVARGAEDDEDGGARHFFMAMKICLKCCDIGHPTKAKAIHLKWSRLIMKEFYSQGDEEKARGLGISPLCDRDDVDSIPKSQNGFINFLVKPLFSVFVEYLVVEVGGDSLNFDVSTTRVFEDNMGENSRMWSNFEKAVGTPQMGFRYDELTDLECAYENALEDEFKNNGEINNPLHLTRDNLGEI